MTDGQLMAQLIERVAPRARLVQTWPLKGGISADMTGVEIELPAGERRRWVIRRPGEHAQRVNPQAAAHEYWLLRLLHGAGFPVPEPLHFEPDGGLFTGARLVLAYVEGRTNFSPDDLIGRIEQMAAQLARLHQFRLGGMVPDFLPDQAARLDAGLMALPERVDDSLDEGRIRQRLAAVWPPRRRSPVLLHGDYWPGNLLWRDGRLTAIVDWEYAERGEPLSDLAISRLDLRMIFGREAMEQLTQIYQELTGFDLADLPVWDLVAALRPAFRMADWAAGWPEMGRPDITEATFRAAHRRFVEQALAQT